MANQVLPLMPSMSSAASRALMMASSVASTVALNMGSSIHLGITFQLSWLYPVVILGRGRT